MKNNYSQAASGIRQATLLLFFSLLVHAGIQAQEIEQQTKLSEGDAQAVLDSYSQRPVADTFAALRSMLPQPVRDAEFRHRVEAALPVEYKQFIVRDTALEQAVRQLFAPVMESLERERCYEIVILKHEVPLVMVDTDSVIVLTTGWLLYLKSDDEALGYVAHEVWHRLFERRMQKARQDYVLFSNTKGGQLQAQSSILEMARIELECDASAAVTLSALGYDATAFAGILERVTQDYGAGGVQGHPLTAQRANLIRKLAISAVPRVSQSLVNIRIMLASDPPKFAAARES